MKYSLLKVLRGFCFKEGAFSKTAFFQSVASLLVLGNYAVQSNLKGMVIDLYFTEFTVLSFDSTAATSIMVITGGTYLANNALKNQKSKVIPQKQEGV